MATFTWAEGTAEEQVEAFARALAELPAQIPEIRASAFGSDLGLGGNADFAVVTDFDDAAGYRAYAAHPAHQRVISELLAPIRAQRLAVQFDL